MRHDEGKQEGSMHEKGSGRADGGIRERGEMGETGETAWLQEEWKHRGGKERGRLDK